VLKYHLILTKTTGKEAFWKCRQTEWYPVCPANLTRSMQASEHTICYMLPSRGSSMPESTIHEENLPNTKHRRMLCWNIILFRLELPDEQTERQNHRQTCQLTIRVAIKLANQLN